MQKTRRLFVGIPLSEALRKRLWKEMQAWPTEALLNTAKENLHITLMFLGFVQEEKIPEILTQVSEAVLGISPFELTFTKMEVIEPGAPRMIWLSGEPSEELKKLREALEKHFAAFTASKKVFRPHVTLAKIKRAKWQNSGAKPDLKERLSLVEPVDTVCVFESTVIDGKRRYDPIDTFTLE